jgi:hypothetical protein
MPVIVAAIESSRAIDEDKRIWLKEHCEQLLAAYGQLRFPLPPGMIHGDAYRGNLLRDGRHVVLTDKSGIACFGHCRLGLTMRKLYYQLVMLV